MAGNIKHSKNRLVVGIKTNDSTIVINQVQTELDEISKKLQLTPTVNFAEINKLKTELATLVKTSQNITFNFNSSDLIAEINNLAQASSAAFGKSFENTIDDKWIAKAEESLQRLGDASLKLEKSYKRVGSILKEYHETVTSDIAKIPKKEVEKIRTSVDTLVVSLQKLANQEVFNEGMLGVKNFDKLISAIQNKIKNSSEKLKITGQLDTTATANKMGKQIRTVQTKFNALESKRNTIKIEAAFKDNAAQKLASQISTIQKDFDQHGAHLVFGLTPENIADLESSVLKVIDNLNKQLGTEKKKLTPQFNTKAVAENVAEINQILAGITEPKLLIERKFADDDPLLVEVKAITKAINQLNSASKNIAAPKLPILEVKDIDLIIERLNDVNILLTKMSLLLSEINKKDFGGVKVDASGLDYLTKQIEALKTIQDLQKKQQQKNTKADVKKITESEKQLISAYTKLQKAKTEDVSKPGQLTSDYFKALESNLKLYERLYAEQRNSLSLSEEELRQSRKRILQAKAMVDAEERIAKAKAKSALESRRVKNDNSYEGRAEVLTNIKLQNYLNTIRKIEDDVERRLANNDATFSTGTLEQYQTQLKHTIVLLGQVFDLIEAKNGGDEEASNQFFVKAKELDESIALLQAYRGEITHISNIAGRAGKDADKLNNLGRQLTSYLNKYGSSLKDHKYLYDAFVDLQNKLNQGLISEPLAKKQFAALQAEARAAGIEVENLWTKLKGVFGQRFRSMVAGQGWMLIATSMRQVYQNVLQLDTAMTELRKVTDATEKEYIKFLDNATDRAKILGATLVDTVSATADMARLGYDIIDASALADTALIYQNVGDGVETIEDASSTIISTMQGFNIQAQDSIRIVDMFNEVANNYASSAGDIGEITKRSAAAMAAAGNTLAQTVALGVAANTTAQDADTVGTAMKTLSARLRASETDLSELGEEMDEYCSSTSKLREEILELSGVDIMIDDETFKSSYDIIVELGKEYNKLTDVSKANLAEILFGKRQMNIGQALLKDYQLAEKILETAQNSAGSALRENEIYLASIQGRLDKINATWQSLSSHLLDDEVVKGVLVIANELLEIVDKIVERVGLMPALIGAVSTAVIKQLDLIDQGGSSFSLESLLGHNGFELSGDEAAAISNFNIKVREGNSSAEELADTLKNCREEIQQYAKDTNYAAMQMQKAGNTTLLNAKGFKGFGQIVKSVGKELLFAGAQFIAITAAFWAISKAVEIGKEWWYAYSDSTMAATKRAEDATAALQETQDELQSINDELETVKERLKELQAKGPLTLTEQNELRQLQLENAELERRVELLKEEERIRKEQQAEANYDVLQSYTNNLPILASDEERTDRKSLSLNAHYGTIAEQIQHYVDLHEMVQDEISALDTTDAKYLDNLEKLKVELAQYAKQIKALSKIVADNPIDPQYLNNEEARQQAKANNQAANRGLYELGIIGPMDYLESSLSTEQWKYFEQEMQKLAQESNVTADSISQAFKSRIPDVFTILEDLGFTIDDLVEHYAALDRVITEKPKQSPAITDTTEELKTHEDKLKALSDAYNEFVDNAGQVSSATLDGFKETFSELDDTEVYENFIKVIGDSSSTVAELQTALDDLVTVYFNQDGAITDLDEDTLALYASQLKQMGVVNALEVAQRKLVITKTNLENVTDEEVNSLWDEVTALDAESNASLEAATKLSVLSAYQALAAGSNFAEVMQNHSDAILNVAKAAGQTAPALLEYAEILNQITTLQQSLRDGTNTNPNITQDIYWLKKKAEKLQTAAQTDFESLLFTEVDFKPPNDSKTSSDAYNKAKARLDNQLERNLISYNQYYAKLEKLGKKYFKKGSDDMNTHLATLADVRKTAYDHYQAQLDAQLTAGKLSLSEYYSKSTALSDKWLKGRVENEKDYLDAVDSVYDQIVSRWEELISKQEEINERKTLDRTWAPGDSELKTWQKKLEQLQKDYVAGLFDNTDEYYDLYYDILKRIRDLDAEELQAQMDDLEERSEGIQDLIDMVDEMLRQRIEDQIEALENLEDKYQDIVDAKKESLDLTREELSYQRELEESNKELADLQAKAALLALDDSREGRAQYATIMEEIRSKQLEISDSQADHTYEATTDALDEATERYQTHIQEKIDDLNEMTEHQGEWLEYVYDYIESTDPSRLFRELRDYNYEFGDGMNDTVADIKLASQDLLIAFERDVPAILEYLKSQKNTVQATIDGASGSGSGGTNLGENYTHQIDSKLNNAIQASVTKANTDKQNRELVTQLKKKDTGLNAWYDDNYKVIYIGEEGNRAVTAGAYNVIQQLKDLSENGQSREAKEKQVNTLLKKLEGKWSYRDLDVLWSGDRFSLFKTTGNNIKRQIFHNGVQQGFASDGKPLQVSSKQRELLAKLQAGEIVLNRNDQERLLVQMQVLETLHNKLKQFELDSSTGINNASPNVIVNIEAPIVIHGTADDDTVQKLNKFRKELKDDTLSAVTGALRSRGYNHNVKSNAQKK